MMHGNRVGRPVWQLREGASLPRPEFWLVVALVLGALLTEVWQSSRMTQLCLRRDNVRAATDGVRRKLEYDRAAIEQHATRAQLAPLAVAIGLAPVQPQQVVALPAQYLADDATGPRSDERSAGSLAERIASALVPEATARSRAH